MPRPSCEPCCQPQQFGRTKESFQAANLQILCLILDALGGTPAGVVRYDYEVLCDPVDNTPVFVRWGYDNDGTGITVTGWYSDGTPYPDPLIDLVSCGGTADSNVNVEFWGGVAVDPAGPLADDIVNPASVPYVGSFGMMFDGVTWDRIRGTSADGLLVNLGLNNDVTVTGSVSILGNVTVDQGTSPWVVSGTVDTEFPPAALLTDNTATPTTTSVASFGMVFDGATWDFMRGTAADGVLVNLGLNNDVTVTGTVAVTQSTSPWVVSGTVDTEFPPAALLTDNTATPTTTSVASFGMVFDGATWDFMRGTAADGVLVNLGLNNDVTVTGTVAVTQSTSPWVVSGTVDTEFPPAALLTDNTATPTTTSVASFGMVFDGATWDFMRGTAADGVLVNLGLNNDVTVTGTVTANAGTGFPTVYTEDVAGAGGETGLIALGRRQDATGSPVTTDGDYEYLIFGSSGGLKVSGDVPNDIADQGDPVKIGAKAFDYDPDAAGEHADKPSDVSQADRVNIPTNLRGEQIEGVNSKFENPTNIDTTYNNTTTTATSDNIECWNYRWCTFGFALDSANTPTDILFEIEVSFDGTVFHKLMNGALASWLYDDVVCATEIFRCLTFPIAARFMRIKVTATGTTAANTFTVDDSFVYFRN